MVARSVETWIASAGRRIAGVGRGKKGRRERTTNKNGQRYSVGRQKSIREAKNSKLSKKFPDFM
jgi:hypothetical protein